MADYYGPKVGTLAAQDADNVAITGGTISGVTMTENFTTSTDPATNAAVTTAIVNAYNGVVVTLTGAGNTQTIQNPTTTATIRKFMVINNDTSNNNLSVVANSVTFVLTPGEGQCFLWDGSAWGPTDLGITDIPVLTTQGGTGRSTGTTAYSLVATGTTATGAQQTLANGATTEVLVGGGASALPVWTTATGSGAPVRATAPTIESPSYTGTLGFAPATELTIATGAITAAQTIHLVDTESDAATDDLVTINGGADGLQLEIRAAHADRTVVIKETGNILTGGSDIRLDDTNKYILFTYDGALSKWVVVGGSGSGGGGFATAAEITTGTEAAKAIAPDQLKLAGIIPANIFNLKPVVNAAVNKLDIFTKSGSAVPDATNPIRIMIPDGNGNTLRSRADAYLSGTSQFIMADATNYWNKGSLHAEKKNGYLYAIWDGTGIVWALGGYSGFNVVPTTTTVTDDDYFLLESGSTYTRNASHYCVCVGKIRYQYYTADSPDHAIYASGEFAPQVIWNPKSDYGKNTTKATTTIATADIAEQSFISLIVKQSGRYSISGKVVGFPNEAGSLNSFLKTGSATYASATPKQMAGQEAIAQVVTAPLPSVLVYLNTGDTIHLGASLTGTSTNPRYIYGDNNLVNGTMLTFQRID